MPPSTVNTSKDLQVRTQQPVVAMTSQRCVPRTHNTSPTHIHHSQYSLHSLHVSSLPIRLARCVHAVTCQRSLNHACQSILSRCLLRRVATANLGSFHSSRKASRASSTKSAAPKRTPYAESAVCTMMQHSYFRPPASGYRAAAAMWMDGALA
jgi:hypothetical protein